jgi:dihydroneopterin aldolase
MRGPIVELHGIEVFAFHGVLDDERRTGQIFRFDVRLECSHDRAAASDDLADAVDYAAVCDHVVAIGTGGPHKLLEHLATLVAEDLLAAFAVDAVQVTVHKPDAPIPHAFDDVTVTVRRPLVAE